ncbi:hypothetical protein K2173_026675 [Erythroxylum novogranatense]|uniref:Uncharacterized protein n=1 Tax=Erythroxylum novogranatense TaxID=1862640 RepID=A0AAV8U0P3_9ROSI|nr:hypothetical protein K2173_026675 [Erythroxylum novogranatense]
MVELEGETDPLEERREHKISGMRREQKLFSPEKAIEETKVIDSYGEDLTKPT